MKPYFIILLTLVVLKLLFYTIKSSLPRQEIQSFIISEVQRQETEVSLGTGGIMDLLQVNKAQLTSDIFPEEGMNSIFSNFYFPDLHQYFAYLMQKNPEAQLDSIANMNDFPDILHTEIKEIHAINQIYAFLKSNNFDNSPHALNSLIPIIHTIQESNGELYVSLQPYEYPDLSYISRIMVKPTNEIFYKNPFLYDGAMRDIKMILTNKVTNEDEVITFD